MTGVELIAAERQRQIDVEGWTATHDDEHDRADLAIVAAQLAVAGTDAAVTVSDLWADTDWNPNDPWGLIRKHCGDRVRMLAIAGALIAAELDRLMREKA